MCKKCGKRIEKNNRDAHMVFGGYGYEPKRKGNKESKNMKPASCLTCGKNKKPKKQDHMVYGAYGYEHIHDKASKKDEDYCKCTGNIFIVPSVFSVLLEFPELCWLLTLDIYCES